MKPTQPPAARRTPPRAGPTGASPRRYDHADHDHAVEFKLSKRAATAIDAAMKGLTRAQQERVRAAIERVSEESGAKVGRWVEQNVIGNANELLAFMAPGLAHDGRWTDLRAIWTFLARLDVPIDHERTARAIEQEHGPELAGRYRQAASL